jgi:hypothetical protein
MLENTTAKQISCGGNTVAVHSVFFFKKTTKLNSQPAQYEKKIDKGHFEKKIIIRKKNHVGKYCSILQCFKEKKLYS